MVKFKTNSQYTEYLKSKYVIKDLTKLSNFIPVDTYEELNKAISSKNIILKEHLTY